MFERFAILAMRFLEFTFFLGLIGCASVVIIFRVLGGHWLLVTCIFIVAVLSEVLGCGTAALGMGMGTVRSFRVGCGMISRGEVGLSVTAMCAGTGIFYEAEVAVMVAVVLLTTLIIPLIMRGAFAIHHPEDSEDSEQAEDADSEESPGAAEYSMIEVQARV